MGFAIQIGSMQRGVNGFVDELTLQSDSTRLNVAKIGACVNKNGEIRKDCYDGNGNPRPCRPEDCTRETVGCYPDGFCQLGENCACEDCLYHQDGCKSGTCAYHSNPNQRVCQSSSGYCGDRQQNFGENCMTCPEDAGCLDGRDCCVEHDAFGNPIPSTGYCSGMGETCGVNIYQNGYFCRRGNGADQIPVSSSCGSWDCQNPSINHQGGCAPGLVCTLQGTCGSDSNTCGNGGPPEEGENCQTCPSDAGCPSGTTCCYDAVCRSSCSADSYKWVDNCVVEGAESQTEAQEGGKSSVKNYCARLGCIYDTYDLNGNLGSTHIKVFGYDNNNVDNNKFLLDYSYTDIMTTLKEQCKQWAQEGTSNPTYWVYVHPRIWVLSGKSDSGHFHYAEPRYSKTCIGKRQDIQDIPIECPLGSRQLYRDGAMQQNDDLYYQEGGMQDNFFLSFPGGASRMMYTYDPQTDAASFKATPYQPLRVTYGLGGNYQMFKYFQVIDPSGVRYDFGETNSGVLENSALAWEYTTNINLAPQAGARRTYTADDIAGLNGASNYPGGTPSSPASSSNIGYSYKYLCDNYYGGCDDPEEKKEACSVACICPYPYTEKVFFGGAYPNDLNWVQGEYSWVPAGDSFTEGLSSGSVVGYDAATMAPYMNNFKFQVKKWKPKKSTGTRTCPDQTNTAYQYLAADSEGASGGGAVDTFEYIYTDQAVNYNTPDRNRALQTGLRTERKSHPVSWLLRDMKTADHQDVGGNGFDPNDKGSYVLFDYVSWGQKVEVKQEKLAEARFGTNKDDYLTYNIAGNGQYKIYVNRNTKSTTRSDLTGIRMITTPVATTEFIYNDADADCVQDTGENPLAGEVGELSCIMIKDLAGSRISKLVFTYATGNSGDRKLKARSGEAFGQRTLLSVRQYGKTDADNSMPAWTFDYGDRESATDNPSFDVSTSSSVSGVLHTDPWGYYSNSQTEWDGGHGACQEGSWWCTYVSDDNSKAWNLKMITYPTKGTVTYTYESNCYQYTPCDPSVDLDCVNYWHDNDDPTCVLKGKGGGPRVASILEDHGRSDNGNPQATLTTFSYEGGVASQKPYINGQVTDSSSTNYCEPNNPAICSLGPPFVCQPGYPTICGTHQSGAMTFMNWNTIGLVNNYVAYGKVTTTVGNGNGYTETYFITPKDEQDADFYKWKSSKAEKGRFESVPVGGFMTSNEWKRGLIKEVRQYDASGTMVSKVVNTYTPVEKANAPVNPDGAWQGPMAYRDESGAPGKHIPTYRIISGVSQLTRTVTTVDGTSKTADYVYNAEGLLKEVKEYQSGSLESGPYRTTDKSYAYEYISTMGPSGKNMLTQVALVGVGHQNVPGQQNSIFSSTLANMRWMDSIMYSPYIDKYGDGRMYPEKESGWIDKDVNGAVDTNEWQTTTFDAYDNFGHLTQKTSPMGFKTKYYFGDSNSCNSGAGLKNGYLTCVEECKDGSCSSKLATTAAYNNDGTLSSITDPNIVVTSFAYDGYMRLWKKAIPPDTIGSPTETYTYHYSANIANPACSENQPQYCDLNYVSTQKKMSATQTPQGYAFTDGLGRDLTTTAMKTTSVSARSNKVFNARGLVEKSTEGFELTLSAGTYTPAAPPSSAKTTKFEYYADPLNRVKKIFPRGDTDISLFSQNLYGGNQGYWFSMVINENGVASSSFTDRLGRSVESVANNFVLNPSFEFDNIAFWDCTEDYSLDSSVNNVRYGKKALKQDPSDIFHPCTTNQRVKLDDDHSTKYLACADVKCESNCGYNGARFFIQLGCVDATQPKSEAYWFNSDAVQYPWLEPVPTSWTRWCIEYQLSDAGTNCNGKDYVFVKVNNNRFNGGNVWSDGITLQKGTTDLGFTATDTYFNDAASRSVNVKNPSQQESKTRADTLGRVRISYGPDYGTRRNLVFDDNGNVLLSADGCTFSEDFSSENPATYGCTRKTRLAYDSLNRLKTVDYEDNGVDVTYYYDTYNGAPSPCSGTDNCNDIFSCPKGRLVAVENTYTGDSTYCYYYDGRGQVRKEIRHVEGQSNDATLLYSYDNAGNMISMTYPNNKVVLYKYNVLNQLESVWIDKDPDPDFLLTTYTYYPDGLIQTKTYDNKCP
ncbi:MAG: hypothetical protein ABIJ21_09280 [Nanoarchaeota archaeon]